MKKTAKGNPGLSFLAGRLMAPKTRLCTETFLSLLLGIFLAGLLWLANNAFAVSFEALHTPWSGYWWPFRQGGLATGLDYRGHPAPLEKYDLLVQGFAPGLATSWYRDNYYDPTAPYWWGECGDWAQASIYEDISFFPSSQDNIVFRVGDKKGLLTLSHSNDIAVREDGSRPEVFHYWLLHYIRDEGKAFVADLDPGEEVWSYPIFKYDMEETRQDSTVSVSVTIYYADDMVDPDIIGTQVKTQTYTYVLTLDPNGDIVGGFWTGNSVQEHPDELTFPLTQRSSDPYLDYQEVLGLCKARDDFLENGQTPVETGPGTYHLILMDQDVYQIPCSQGDKVVIRIEKEPGSAQDIEVTVTDGQQVEVWEAVAREDEPAEAELSCDEPPYYIYLSQEDYSDPNIYTMEVDLRKGFSREIPYIPKNGMWSGFALVNPRDTKVDSIMLVTYESDGDPIQTVMGPLELSAGEKRVFFFEDLPWRQHEYQATERMALLADSRVFLVNLFGSPSGRLGGFVQNENRGTHLVIPDVMGAAPSGDHMQGAIINESGQEAQLTIRVFQEDGTLYDEILWVLSPGEMLRIDPGNYPFYSVPSNGWIDVQADRVISGYERITSAYNLDTIFAMPVVSSHKIVPHVASPQGWRTTLTLINPNAKANQIAIHPRLAGSDQGADTIVQLGPWEKAELDLGAIYGKGPGDPLYHSLLELTSEYSFAGYYSYAQAGQARDRASMPLVDFSQLKETLFLPHYARSNDMWWTGFVIANPSNTEARVRIEPYDMNGNLIQDLVLYQNIQPGGYEVMLGTSLWGSRARDVSFAKFSVEDSGAKICGFYLYGNRTEGRICSDMLAGANM